MCIRDSGYFVSLNAMPGTAKRTLALCKDCLLYTSKEFPRFMEIISGVSALDTTHLMRGNA